MNWLEKRTQETLPSASHIEEFAWAAREYIQRSLNIQLDDTAESLAFVDHYVHNLRQQGLPKAEIVNLIASALGVYFGQVVLSKVKGRWYGPVQKGKENVQDPWQWRIELSEVPLSFSPVAMAMAAIQAAENDELDTTLWTPAELSDLLQEMFSRMTPVSEDYYYSLTGRLETLLYSVELLYEIIQAKKLERKKQRSSE